MFDSEEKRFSLLPCGLLLHSLSFSLLFSHMGFFIHSGFWVGRSTSVADPSGCPFSFTFLFVSHVVIFSLFIPILSLCSVKTQFRDIHTKHAKLCIFVRRKKKSQRDITALKGDMYLKRLIVLNVACTVICPLPLHMTSSPNQLACRSVSRLVTVRPLSLQ